MELENGSEQKFNCSRSVSLSLFLFCRSNIGEEDGQIATAWLPMSLLDCSKDHTGFMIWYICHITYMSQSFRVRSLLPSMSPLIPLRVSVPAPYLGSQELSMLLYSNSPNTVSSWCYNSPVTLKAQERGRGGPWPPLCSHALIKVWHAGRLISVFQIDGWLLLECLALPTCSLAKQASCSPAWETAFFPTSISKGLEIIFKSMIKLFGSL